MGGRKETYNGTEPMQDITVDIGNWVVFLNLSKFGTVPMSVNQARNLRDALNKVDLFFSESFEPITVSGVGG